MPSGGFAPYTISLVVITLKSRMNHRRSRHSYDTIIQTSFNNTFRCSSVLHLSSRRIGTIVGGWHNASRRPSTTGHDVKGCVETTASSTSSHQPWLRWKINGQVLRFILRDGQQYVRFARAPSKRRFWIERSCPWRRRPHLRPSWATLWMAQVTSILCRRRHWMSHWVYSAQTTSRLLSALRRFFLKYSGCSSF